MGEYKHFSNWFVVPLKKIFLLGKMGDDAWSSWILSAKGLISFSSPREEVHEVQIEIVGVVNKLLSSTILTKQESSLSRIKMCLCWLLFAFWSFF